MDIADYSGRIYKVLIAEDTDLNYILLVQALKDCKVDIDRALNGLEAVNYCMTNAPDIVLMDINMPEMDGIEATKQIRTFDASLPIIAQTALDLPGQRKVLLDAGCNDYISKPIDLQQFLTILREYIQI